MARYSVRMDIRENGQLRRAIDLGISKQPKLTSLRATINLITTVAWFGGFNVKECEINQTFKDRGRFINECESTQVQSFYNNQGLELILEIIKIDD